MTQLKGSTTTQFFYLNNDIFIRIKCNVLTKRNILARLYLFHIVHGNADQASLSNEGDADGEERSRVVTANGEFQCACSAFRVFRRCRDNWNRPVEGMCAGIESPVSRVLGDGWVRAGTRVEVNQYGSIIELCQKQAYGRGMEITTSCNESLSFSSSYSMLTSQVPSFDGVGQQFTSGRRRSGNGQQLRVKKQLEAE